MSTSTGAGKLPGLQHESEIRQPDPRPASGQSEHSDDEERKGGAEGKNFPEKLYHVLEMPQHAEIIAWGKDGKSFSVVNQDAFQTSVLRDFFNGSKFSSFVRQLNVYGFRKTSHGKPWEFSNELFLRGRPDLLPSLKRRKPRPSRTDDAAGAVLQNALAEAAAAIQSAALSMLFKSNSGGGAGGDGPSNETTQNALAALNALHTANRMIQKRESGSLEAGGVRSESGGQGAGAGPFAGLGVGGGEQLLAMLAQQQQQQMSQQVQLQKRIKRASQDPAAAEAAAPPPLDPSHMQHLAALQFQAAMAQQQQTAANAAAAAAQMPSSQPPPRPLPPPYVLDAPLDFTAAADPAAPSPTNDLGALAAAAAAAASGGPAPPPPAPAPPPLPSGTPAVGPGSMLAPPLPLPVPLPNNGGGVNTFPTAGFLPVAAGGMMGGGAYFPAQYGGFGGGFFQAPGGWAPAALSLPSDLTQDPQVRVAQGFPNFFMMQGVGGAQGFMMAQQPHNLFGMAGSGLPLLLGPQGSWPAPAPAPNAAPAPAPAPALAPGSKRKDREEE